MRKVLADYDVKYFFSTFTLLYALTSVVGMSSSLSLDDDITIRQ